jgi:hypothetical protein
MATAARADQCDARVTLAEPNATISPIFWSRHAKAR